MTEAAPSNSNSSQVCNRSQNLQHPAKLSSIPRQEGAQSGEAEAAWGWGLKTDTERGRVRRCREQRQGHEAERGVDSEAQGHRKSEGVADGDRWRWTCQAICPLSLSPSLGPSPCPADSSPAWKPSCWPSGGEGREVPHARPVATINSWTCGTYRGLGTRISCL